MVWRALAFLALWLILVGGVDPADRPAGIVAIMTATWASLRLLPPGAAPVSLTRLAHLIGRLLRQSMVAGIDVAWRALDSRLPLRPGFVVFPARLPPGPALQTFYTLTNLAPGTLAAPNKSGAIVAHCLDVELPIADNLKADARLLLAARGRGRTDG
jgi:multicomponent Na+:H+ antiporter subunit E